MRTNNIPPVTMEFQTTQYTQRSLDTSTRQGGKYFMASFAFFDWSLHLILFFFLSKFFTGSGTITMVTLTSCLTNKRTWSQGFSTTPDTHMHKICDQHMCATQWSSSVMSESFKHIWIYWNCTENKVWGFLNRMKLSVVVLIIPFNNKMPFL